MTKILKLLGLVKELLTGDYKSVGFWSAIIGILVVVFGLNIEAADQAQIAGILASVAAAGVTAWFLFKKYAK